MSEQETLREIASTLARVDERTKHILAHQSAQNGRVNKHDDRLDQHDLEFANLNGSVKGIRSNFKIYAAMAALGVCGAAQHENIGALLQSLLGK